MKGIYSCVLLLLCLCCLPALNDGANQVYMASDTNPELRLDGEIYSHSGYPNTHYSNNINTSYDLTSLLYPGVTTALVMRFSDPFSVSPRDDSDQHDTTCLTSDFLYVAGHQYCNWLKKPDLNQYFSKSITSFASLEFYTNSIGVGKGFQFSYKVAAVIHNEESNTNILLHHSLSGRTEGYITSHLSYPNNYTANINSALTLWDHNPNLQVHLTFMDFSIFYKSEYPGCIYDRLAISDGDGEWKRFCSDPAHAPEINKTYNFNLSDQGRITLWFVTGGNPTSSRGFLLKYAVSTKAATTTTTAATTTTTTTPTTATTTATTAIHSTSKPSTAAVSTLSEKSITDTDPTILLTSSTHSTAKNHSQSMSDEASMRSHKRIIPIASGVSAGLVIIAVVLVITILYLRRMKSRPRKSDSVDYGYSYNPGGDESVVNQRTATNQQSSASHLYADEYSSLSDALSGQDRPSTQSTPGCQGQPSAQTTPGTGGNYSEYTLAEEITSEPAHQPERATPADSTLPPTSADSGGGVYDLADDYQLAAAAGDEYENFESVKRSEEDKNMTDTYAPITASTKKSNSRNCDTVTELVDNDLYGT